MDSFTSMKTKIDALGLYKTEKGTNIYAELKAYAAGIDELTKILDTMLRELFVETAESYGISNREILLGKEKDDYPLEKRREMLIIYEQMMGGKCTPDAFENILRGYGIDDFTIKEAPTHRRIEITVNDNLTETQQKYISERVKADFPSHINTIVKYSS